MTGELEPIDFFLQAANLDEYGWPAAAAGAAAWFFGPSIKRVRTNLAQWTDYQSANILGLFRKIKARQDELVPLDPIHPRVAAQILETASWSDDDLVQNYLAGLTIDASTQGESDDALFYARIVDRMTASQVRLHYAVYRTLIERGTPFQIGYAEQSAENAVWISTAALDVIIGGGGDDFAVDETGIALTREALLDLHFSAGPEDIARAYGSRVDEHSTAFTVTPLGAALFSRAHGKNYTTPHALFDLKREDRLGAVPERVAVAPLSSASVAYA